MAQAAELAGPLAFEIQVLGDAGLAEVTTALQGASGLGYAVGLPVTVHRVETEQTHASGRRGGERTSSSLSKASVASRNRGLRPEADLLQKPDLSGEVLALAGDAGVADAVAGPREEFRVEVGCGAGCRVRPGPRAAGMRIAGPDFSVRILA
ncbi:hypothetical protein [Streptomyces halstedii]|uniref:hypothetical protein n=1 Tax=Streptomyces halstedii TaxID=1944 RepID=UPI0038218D8B